MLQTGSQYYYTSWPWVRDGGVKWTDALHQRLVVDFEFPRIPESDMAYPADDRVDWTSTGPATGTGQFKLADKHAAVFVGFAGNAPVNLGDLRIDKLQTPFATLILVPADATQPLATADRLLLTAAAHSENTGMQWDAQRHTISTHWGDAPPRIEVVQGTLSVAGKYHVFTLTADGKRDREIDAAVDERTTFKIGTAPTMWYELAK